jgi:methylenetetrahydrofolate reductase (NADPH)
VATFRSSATAPDDDQRRALRELLERSRFELIPLRSAMERAEALPPGAATTVTASPSHGIESTIVLCEELIARGHTATPHLAAHMFRDRAHLAEVLERCGSNGMREAFVVGGDARDRGELHDAPALLSAMQ